MISLAPKRIVLTTYGSLGDLHPYLALAIGLRDRGHLPVIATHGAYGDKILAEGVGFAPVAPDLTELGDPREFARRAFATQGGEGYLLKHAILAPRHRSYADQMAAVGDNTDLIINHPLTYTMRLVAEKKNVPWISVALAPAAFMSAYEPFVFPQAPWVSRLQPLLGVERYRKLQQLIKDVTYSWTAPIHALRAEVGLPPIKENLIFEGAWSRLGTIALFPPALGEPQPDWHPNTVQTGFCVYDKAEAGVGMPPEITAFLASGDAPIVFTLGSAAVMDAGTFYTVSAAAAAKLGKRAILLTGKDPANVPANLPAGILAAPYAPYSELFPHCAAVVHQGGVGTTGQAMRAGRPQIVLPHGFDQYDNAERMAKRGIGRVVTKFGYTTANVARELSTLLGDPAYADRAANVAEQIRGVNGIQAACDVVETVIRHGCTLPASNAARAESAPRPVLST